MTKLFNVTMTEDQLQVCLRYCGIQREQIRPIEVSTTDPRHPVNKSWEMNDPYVVAPPNNGEILLVIQQGGVLIPDKWKPDYLAWAYKPCIPQSVKDRIYGYR